MTRRVLLRHLALTVLVALLLSALAMLGIWRVAEEEARRTAERVATRTAAAVLVPLRARDFSGPVDRQALLADLAPFLGSRLIERVKVLSADTDGPDGTGDTATVRFSDEPRAEGRTVRVPPDLAATLDRGGTVVRPVPDDPEHALELALPGERYEVWFAFRDAADRETRLELYVPVAATETARHAVAVLVPLVLAGLLLVALATVPLSVALARRLARDREEQRAARDYGLAAAELARRDLAERLHAGVIPDLAGASLLLQTVPDPRVARARDVVDADLAHLRGLLDELAPPPAADDLAAALRESAAQLAPDGPPVAVTVRGEVPAEVAELLHRIAGELLRNAVRHAAATHVEVAVSAGPPVVLTVSDDGRGFAPDAPRRPGHIGLQLVRQVVQDSGGTVRVTSGPGGTAVAVTLAAARGGRARGATGRWWRGGRGRSTAPRTAARRSRDGRPG